MSTKIPKAIIIIVGGIITSVLCNTHIDITVVDYDTDSGDEEDFKEIPQSDGSIEPAYVYKGEVLEVNPLKVTEILESLKIQ